MSDITKLEKKMDKQFDDLTALMSQFSEDMRVKLEVHDEEFKKLNEKYDHLINTIDGFIKRIDDYEVELAARDHKIDRLERWIEQNRIKNWREAYLNVASSIHSHDDTSPQSYPATSTTDRAQLESLSNYSVRKTQVQEKCGSTHVSVYTHSDLRKSLLLF